MSEHAPKLASPERGEAHAPKHERGEIHTSKVERGELAKSKQEHNELLDEARQELNKQEATPNPIEAVMANEAATQVTPRQQINRELKAITLRRELQSIRRKLPAPQRALSRIIHQPAVRIVSEGAGKTVSRPSGLLGGGLVAFLGTGSYYYLARHIGFSYNSFVFLALFAGGFVVGVGLEMLAHAAGSRQQTME